ncbi:general secretion pathway protein GspB [uncultured Aquincola sp.]|uniref:general secretion pathway protein GspB n=1 Tax=uncultured Aquincola sp. TaxID=886556 RepID=UPI0032B28B87
MSLVLDALKKADAERERERSAVPGLHARPLPLAEAPPARTSPALAWGVAAVAVGVAGALGWQLLRPTAAPVAAPVVRAAPDAAPMAAAGSAAAGGAPTAPVRAPVPAPVPAPAPAPFAAPAPAPAALRTAPPAPAPAPEPQRPSAARPATPPVPAPPPAIARSTAPAPAPAAVPAPRPAPEPESPALRETDRVYDDLQALPEDVRRSLPRLTIGGAMYSESPANRMLIVNGQLFRENDRLADDLVLEQIALKSAVLRYRNYRFRIRY